jgi:hypothetical protein
LLQNVKTAAGLTPRAGGIAGTLDFHAGNKPMPVCRAPVFNPANLAGKKSRGTALPDLRRRCARHI